MNMQLASRFAPHSPALRSTSPLSDEQLRAANNTCHRNERVMRSTSHEQEERNQFSAVEAS